MTVCKGIRQHVDSNLKTQLASVEADLGGVYNPLVPSRTTPSLAWATLVVAGLGVIGGAAWLAFDHDAYHVVLLCVFLPSLVLTAAGCWTIDRSREQQVVPPALLRWSSGARWFALVLVAMAGLARVWGFPDWPPVHGVGFEEEELGAAATEFLTHRSHPLEHRLPAYAAALGFALFGPSITSLRTVFVAGSALAPLLFLGACRRLARPPVALLCTALYGFSWWATAAGRFADEIFFVAPFTAAVVWLLLAMLDARSALAALGLGLLSGALMFEYTAYRLVPVLVAGYLLVRLARRAMAAVRSATGSVRQALAGSIRPVFARAAAFAIGLSVSIVPATTAFVQGHNDTFVEAFRRHTDGPEATVHMRPGEIVKLVFERAERTICALVVPNQGAPTSWINSHPHRPHLGPLAGAVLGLGCVLAVFSLRARLHALLAVWIAASVVTTLVVPVNENSMRLFAVFPVAWLLAASGLERVWPGRNRPRTARVLAAVAAVTAIAVAASDAVFVHRRLASDTAVSATFATPCVTTARIIGALPAGSHAVLASEVCGGVADNPVLNWLLGGREVTFVESLADAISALSTRPESEFLMVATTVPQPGLGRLLARELPVKVTPFEDPWPHRDLELVALRLDVGQPEEPRPRWEPHAGGFLVRSFEGPPGEPAGPGQPSSGSRLIEEHREPFFTSLGQRWSTLKVAESLRWSPDTVYWVAWSGVAVPPPGCGGIRLRVRSGRGWLWLDGDLILATESRGSLVVFEERVMHFEDGRSVTVEACSFHTGNDIPALQMEWLDDGPGELVSFADSSRRALSPHFSPGFVASGRRCR